MIFKEGGIKIYYHYSSVVGGVEHYSEEAPTDPKAWRVHFIEEGEQIDDPITDGSGKPIAIFAHRHNGSSSIGPMESALPVELEALPGMEADTRQMLERENE